MDAGIKETLIGWAEEYNDPKYFQEDPIIFPTHFARRYKDGEAPLADVEIERSSSAYVLGRYFEFGLGVEKDESKAADYYTKANEISSYMVAEAKAKRGTTMKNGIVSIWMNLLGFERNDADLGVSRFLSQTGYKPDDVCLLLCSPDFFNLYGGMEKEYALFPDNCAYWGIPKNKERERQPWTNFDLKRLVENLKNEGIDTVMVEEATLSVAAFEALEETSKMASDIANMDLELVKQDLKNMEQVLSGTKTVEQIIAEEEARMKQEGLIK